MNGLGLQPLLTGEGEQLAGELGSALHGLGGVLHPALDLVPVVGRVADQLQVAGDRLQQVVEVVRDAAGQLADRLDLLGLHKRRLGPLAMLHLGAELIEDAVPLGQGEGEFVVLGLQLRGRRDREHLGQKRPQQHGGRHGGGGGDRLDRSLRPVISVPEVPDTHDVGQAARQDEQREKPEHLAELDIPALAHEGDQRNRNGEIGGSDQRVGDDVRPHQLGSPEQTVAMGSVVAVEKLAKEFDHSGTSWECGSFRTAGP